MAEPSKYQQLQPEERMTIAFMKQQGSSMRAMARMLGRSGSTISRELERNSPVTQAYASHTAQVHSAGRRVAGGALRSWWPLPLAGLAHPDG